MLKKILLTTLVFCLFLGTHLLKESAQKPHMKVSMQKSAFNFNVSFLKLFHLGHKRLISSLLWIKTLMDGDLDHYMAKDLNSWMYLRFNTIAELDPKFYELYVYGGQYLSVIKDDILGAKNIYERGLKYYNNDFWLNFYNASNYYFELDDFENAKKYFSKIEKHPQTMKSAPFLPSLLARINANKGDLESAYLVLLSTYTNTSKESPLRARYEQSLYSLRSEIDLNCLNNMKTQNCRKEDFFGRKYRVKNNKYIATQNWQPFRILSRKPSESLGKEARQK